MGAWDDAGCLWCLDEKFGVVVKHVFEVGDDLCHGVRFDVECALGSFLVRGEAGVLQPLARVVVPDLYSAVRVVLDG